MKKLLFVFISVSFLLNSCTNQSLPEGILSQDEMLPIVVDLHIAEEVIQSYNWNYDSSRVMFHSVYKKEILKKHNVDFAQFDSSYVYYERNVELMNKLYERVVDTLSLRVSMKKLQ